jgi:adenosylmethionine-8-amino-7-oxononanoate aminotransferase
MNPSALNIWHPFTQSATDPAPIRVVRAEGVYLYTDDGRRIIDGISSWWVNLHGHSHPAIAAAIANQAKQLDHVLLAGFTHEPAEELARKLSKILPPTLTEIFFSDNGSTSVEVALKMAVQYWKNVGQPKKSRIVALEHAYHGDTVGALSLSADTEFTAAFSSLRFSVDRVHTAYCYRCPVGKHRATCDIECTKSLQQALESGHDEIAAVIVEPLLQGAGGMIVHPVEFLQGVRQLCTEHNVLLIADEVFTGFGRTGKMFACELAAIVPDLMCLSKGLTGGFLPMAATICTAKIHDAFVSQNRAHTFYHGHSYTGNPLGCAAAIANLTVFESEPVFEKIAKIESIHKQRLATIAGHDAVGEVRCIGSMAAIELNAEDAGYFSRLRPRLYEFFISRGVLLRPLGNVIYVLPPFIIKPEELHYVHDVIADAIQSI